MTNELVTPKKYEEHAYVLDFMPHGKSILIKGREGSIIQAIGKEWLTLLEVLALNNTSFEIGEPICIAKEGRTKVISVLGRIRYEDLTNDAKNDIPGVIEKIVLDNEKKYVIYFNELQPVTPRLHALELIPGIGKTFMMQILQEREKRSFESFEDLQKRVGLRDPAKSIAKRIIEEITGELRINLFIKK
jgi:putative nucleotide binding protein